MISGRTFARAGAAGIEGKNRGESVRGRELIVFTIFEVGEGGRGGGEVRCGRRR